MVSLMLNLRLKNPCFCKITSSNKLLMTEILLVMIMMVIKQKSLCKILTLIALVYYLHSIFTPSLNHPILTFPIVITNHHIPTRPVHQTTLFLKRTYHQGKQHQHSSPDIILTTTQESQHLKWNAFELT